MLANRRRALDELMAMIDQPFAEGDGISGDDRCSLSSKGLIDHGHQFVEVPDAEFASMGCNVLAIAPREVVMVKGNPETQRRMEAAAARSM